MRRPGGRGTCPWRRDIHVRPRRPVHDPVTLDKVVAWSGRHPSFTYLVPEPTSGVERLVCVFDRDGRRWGSLDERVGKPGFRPAPGVLPFDLRRRPLTIRQSLGALRMAGRRRLARTFGRRQPASHAR